MTYKNYIVEFTFIACYLPTAVRYADQHVHTEHECTSYQCSPISYLVQLNSKMEKLNEERNVMTILNVCPDLPLSRANRWTKETDTTIPSN